MKNTRLILLLLISLINFKTVIADESFNQWLDSFKIRAVKSGVSKETVDLVMDKAIFLPKVIEYDRYQPEFYEDTKTYVGKRSNKKKVVKGKRIYKKNSKLIEKVDQEFLVEKELLLALMGIETNFGTYLGKMDIISSLATLSYDKRRSEFFSQELITALKLIDNKKIDKDILYGSWAGAFGNFQFMPSTISNYAVDYNKNDIIELKNIEDSFASAANYMKKIGWKKNNHCFYRVELKDNIPSKFLNSSARNIKHKKNFRFYKKFIKNDLSDIVNDKEKVAIITPDVDIIPGSQTLNPAYIVFSNYEKVLKWNRSLRFALAVCTLKDKFKDEL